MGLVKPIIRLMGQFPVFPMGNRGIVLTHDLGVIRMAQSVPNDLQRMAQSVPYSQND
jgi:hypothetical protein